jgi:hypothetical protein
LPGHHASTFFVTPLVIEPSPGQLSSDTGRLPLRPFDLVQFGPLERAAVFDSLLTAGRLDEDTTHGLGSGGEEVAAAPSWRPA